jgi:anti-sigma B factor antagonist
MEGIQVSTEFTGSNNQISIIRVGGYIDTTTSSELERALDSLLKQSKFSIIVDLGNVDYISSAGWGIFISEIKSIRENNGDLKLVRMIPDVYEIFELLEFHHILDVYDTLEEAIEQFEASPALATSDISVAPKMAAKMATEKSHAPQKEEVVEEDNHEAEAEKPDSSLADLPLEDKIKDIVKKNPTLGTGGIKKLLASADYGYAKAGWFQVRGMLKKMGLKSKNNRITFAMQQK